MILVTGATGHFGNAVIEFLLKKGVPASNISALARDSAKAEALKAKGVTIKIGDYDNYSALMQAFKGVDQLLLVSGSDLEKRGKQHENVVKAAVEAGVKHIYYTSIDRKSDNAEASPIALVMKTHLDTERHIKSSGMAYTLLRNNIYADMIPMFLGEQVANTGVFFPAGEGKVAFATRENMAEATAAVLASREHQNKELVFSNTDSISFGDIAAMLSDTLGTKIPYVNPTAEDFAQALSSAGVPAPIVTMSVEWAEAFKQGTFSQTSTDLEKLLGRKPTTVKEYLSGVYSS
ncbi:SDR family oxidoreductase [Cesiribacter sp. SM1]|uniref:SDR family oxidoreductase n=1 Tax=Cesiribacter sp. SM1 TaxID=2861196 RepID=UPI001CD335FB|nr:SDR family oxidoreductase [Cesiribacter sp. SM1]